MQKKIAVLTEATYKDGFSRLFDKANALGTDAVPVFFDDLKKTAECDALFVFLPEKSPVGLTEYLKENRLYARVRTVETERGGRFFIVDNAFGGIYDEEKGYRKGEFGREAYDVERCSEIEIERLLRIGYEYCEKYGCSLTSLDLSDRLYTSRLWRRTAYDVATDYPDIPIQDLFLTDYLQNLPDDGVHVVASTALFSDVVYASVLSRGKKYAHLSFVGDSNFGIYVSSDPLSLPHALNDAFGRTFGWEKDHSALFSDDFSFFNF